MAKRARTAAKTAKRVTGSTKKVKRQAVRKAKAIATKARRAGRVTRKAAGKTVRRSKTTLNKAAMVIGTALGKAVGTIEKALK